MWTFSLFFFLGSLLDTAKRLLHTGTIKIKDMILLQYYLSYKKKINEYIKNKKSKKINTL